MEKEHPCKPGMGDVHHTSNEILSKVNPEMLAGAEYLEGDGSPGSLRLFRLGPGKASVHGLYVFTGNIQ